METENFGAAMHLAGFDCPGPLVADGKLHRFKAEGDHARNSWYVLHSGPPAAGAFGCWKRGVRETWCERNSSLSERDWQTVRKQWDAADAERKRAEREARHRACKTAAWVYDRAKPVTAHPYLTAKRVGVHGELREYRGALVLSLRDSEGQLHSLQFVAPDGLKRFLRGGKVEGCYYTVSDKPDGPLVLAEGYATAASIHEATGYATIAALNCGNLLTVAKTIGAKWPQREFIVAADNDQWTHGNPGLSEATEAANTIRARLAIPQFKDIAGKPSDFNDLAALEGLAAITTQLTQAETPRETDEQTFERLAKLSHAEYDRCRDSEARRLDVRTSTLDQEIEARRQGPYAAGRALQGFAVDLPSPEPWAAPVDGAAVLAQVAESFRRFIALPTGAANMLALWTAHTHCFEAFTHTPRLNVHSPEKQCGKTVLLDVAAVLTPRALRTENTTPAVLFRLAEKVKPTLLLDEVDTYLNDADELRGLLNAGHKRGGMATRCEGENNEVRGFNCFCPAALAGIGHLPGTLHDRSIHVRLTRAKPGEVAARFDSRHIAPERELCRRLARWAADNFARLTASDPKMPEGAFNRLADKWRPLFAIAEVAGGDWPHRTAEAFALLTSGDDLDAQGIGTMLLADIAAVFARAGVDKLPSAKLASALGEFEGRPWAEFGKHRKPITPNQLATQLRRFGVAPRTIKLPAGDTAKGYHREDFKEAFERFLPYPPVSDRNPVTTPENTEDSALSETSPSGSGLRPENATLANENGAGYAVTVQEAVEIEKEPAVVGEPDLI